MRLGLRRAIASTMITCAFATPGFAESRAEESSPVGNPLAAAALEQELDPLFDDAFDAELDLSSDLQPSDPFENSNRKVFTFNQGVDRLLLGPVTRGYRFLVPDPARKGIRRLFLNLDSPRILVNDLFQLRFLDAGKTLARFMLNTTLGVGGLLEVGEAAGIARHDSDFGETMATFGIVSGPYIVLPVFGPSTVRDGIGSVVDLAFQPLTYILGPGQILVNVYISGGNGLTALDANRDKIAALESSSVDFYAAMRSAYLQNRRATLAEGKQPESSGVDVKGPLAESSHHDTNRSRVQSAYRFRAY